ncbi:MAG: Rid family hydrolase, partial [Proteobacteria bacterium]|nr:Rid family hydrolase [Pseudomonadota bacterium]
MAAAPRREIRVDREMMEPLSHHTDAVLCGDFLYLSGAAPLDTAANVIAPGDLVKQCEATCHNTDLMLQAADMSFKDIAHFKILMEDVIYWPLIEPVCRSYLGEVRPSSTRVGMGHPAVPGMLLEIEAIAYKPQNGGPARQEIRCEDLYDPLGYNVDVIKCGDFAFLSGTGPLDRNGNAVGFGDAERQSHKTMENMQVMLEAAGMGFGDVARVLYFLENVHDLRH